MTIMKDDYTIFLVWSKILLSTYMSILTYPQFALLWFVEQTQRVQTWLSLNKTKLKDMLHSAP